MKTPTILLREGEIYFIVGFFDRDLSVPCISTYVYCGMEGTDHLFMNAEGYLARQTDDGAAEAHYISYKDGKITSVLDRENLISWLKAEHSPQLPGRSYAYHTV